MVRSPYFQPTRLVATSLAAALLTVALGGCGRKEAAPPAPAAGTGAAQQKAAGSAAELEFLDAMTQHHQAGIEMATSAQAKLQSAELKAIAAAIPAAQQAEIDRMRAWRGEWYADAPAPATTAPAPTAERQLDTMAAGAAYDALFATTLADHHEAGITIAEQALPRLRHKPVRRFARQMMRALRAEVSSLRARA